MHPLIARIGAVKQRMARSLWEPKSVVLGWVTYDALNDDLQDQSGVFSQPRDWALGDFIWGIPLERSQSYPIGGWVRLRRDVFVTHEGPRHVEWTSVPL